MGAVSSPRLSPSRRAFNALVSMHPAWIEARVLDAARRNLPREMRSRGVPGLQLAIALDDRPVRMLSLGLADAADCVPMRDSTRFRAASMGKPIAALVVLLAAHAGMLDLDQPLDGLLSRLPAFRSTSRGVLTGITPRRLMNHTAGFETRHPPTRGPHEANISIEEFVEGDEGAAFIPEPSRAPGTACAYSGVGYLLLEYVVGRLAGIPLPRLAQELLIGPLSLRHTTFDRAAQFDAGLSAEHDASGARVESRWPIGPGTSGLVSTAADVARCAREVIESAAGRNGVIPTGVARACLARADVADAGFTCGWHLHRGTDPETLDAGGGRPGFRGFVQMTPSARISAAAMTNAVAGVDVMKLVFGLIHTLAKVRRGGA